MERRILSQLLPCLILILCCAGISYGQSSNTSQPALDSPKAESSARSAEETRPNSNAAEPPEDASISGGRLSSFEFLITSMIVGVALIALFMEFILLRRVPNLKAEDALRVFAVTLILIGTLFFISAGFDSKQIAPAMGLFGTVAGYLLGKNIDRKESKNE